MTAALEAGGADVFGFDIDWGRAAKKDRTACVRVDGDVRNLAHLTELLSRDGGFDAVVHLAAQPIVGEANDDPLATFDHNIAGTWTLLEACRLARRQPAVLVASSDKAYGEGGTEAYEETMPLQARHPYAVSKACTDLIAQTYAESYGLPVVISRCGNLYGGGDLNWSRIVPGTIRSVLAGERPVIRSDGSPVRDYLYVEDVADGVLLLVEALLGDSTLAGEAFNFGGGDRVSVRGVVERILEHMGASLAPTIRAVATNEIAEQRVGAEKVWHRLGWRPTHSLDGGLEKTIEWYRAYARAAF